MSIFINFFLLNQMFVSLTPARYNFGLFTNREKVPSRLTSFELGQVNFELKSGSDNYLVRFSPAVKDRHVKDS